MTIRADGDALRVESLDPFEAEMLRRLPGCAAVDDDATGRRLFTAPTGGTDPEADAEWREVVEPGLRELCESSVDVVQKDVATMAAGDDGEEFSFPIEHGRAWIHTLNQARLALGARHDVNEEEMNGWPVSGDRDKIFAIMQIEFFGFIVHVLLEFVEL